MSVNLYYYENLSIHLSQLDSTFQVQYDRRESSKIPMHAGCGKKCGKDYNTRGNPANFMRDPRNVSRSLPEAANFTREFFMRDAWKYFPRKIDL